ncbi:MAG: DHA2 family efflux MFS transporter permease subunit [Verrucomicrobium sp.]|nr:DHA2 family efflux MFS transporter permease subunit [Verrucomicrobium sp.]
MNAPAANEPLSRERLLALFGVMLGAFMAVLDIQITNASLNDIAGAIGSALDEASWISTAYLVAEIIIIGVSAWLGRVFSIKKYLLFSCISFTFFSICCAFAHSLNMMIFFRALQGLTGGALIPLAFSLIMILLPPAKRTIGTAAFTVTVIFAPAIGPTIGGWLTDNYGWQWIFFINLVPGLIMTALIAAFLPQDQARHELLKEGDYLGIFCMALGLGSLEYVLEEGERKDWFGNPVIQRFAVIGVVFTLLFLIIEMRSKKPFLHLNVFRYRSFTLSSLIQSVLGLALYGSVYIIPLYLAQVQRYSPYQIGLTLMWAGIPQLFLIPFVPWLMGRIDIRLIIGTGLWLFGASCFLNAYLSPDYAMDQFQFANVIRAIGQPLILVPLLSIATAGVPREEAGSASALFNMMRNLGGSVGIAILSTEVTWREHLHSVRVGEMVTAYTPALRARLDALTQTFVGKGIDPATAASYALKAVDNAVRKQSQIMAFSDCFYIMGWCLFLASSLLLFVPKPKGHAAGGH